MLLFSLPDYLNNHARSAYRNSSLLTPISSRTFLLLLPSLANPRQAAYRYIETKKPFIRTWFLGFLVSCVLYSVKAIMSPQIMTP